MAGGLRIVTEIEGLAPIVASIARAADADTTGLMTDIGATLESSTRERIEETKTSPDGTAWPPNRAGTSILLATGRHLRDSIAYIASRDEVQVGSSWEFAHVHQGGAVITAKAAKALAIPVAGGVRFVQSVTIPQREFVGMSAEDIVAVDALASDYLTGLLAGGIGRVLGGGSP